LSDYLDRDALLVCEGWDKSDVDRLLRDTDLYGLDGQPVVEEERLPDLLAMFEREDREDHFREEEWEDYLDGRHRTQRGRGGRPSEDDPFGDLTPNPEGGGK
jgi:hypothetical protein